MRSFSEPSCPAHDKETPASSSVSARLTPLFGPQCLQCPNGKIIGAIGGSQLVLQSRRSVCMSIYQTAGHLIEGPI